MKVLIVDDSAEMRQTIRAHCARVAHEFAEATDGAAAIETCASFKPDWVLMDIKMKPMNGLIATRKIRRRFQGARVVIVTMFDDEEMRAASHQAGAFAFLTKDHLADLPELLTGKTGPLDPRK